MDVKWRWEAERARTGSGGRATTTREPNHVTTRGPECRTTGRGPGRSARAHPTQRAPQRARPQKRKKRREKLNDPAANIDFVPRPHVRIHVGAYPRDRWGVNPRKLRAKYYIPSVIASRYYCTATWRGSVAGILRNPTEPYGTP